MNSFPRVARAFMGTAILASLSAGKAHASQPLLGPDAPRVEAIAVATFNVEKTAHRYAKVFGVSSWDIFKDRVVSQSTAHGPSTEATVLRASGRFAGLTLELIQPLTGTTPLDAFLKERRVPALHHFVVSVKEPSSEVIAALRAAHYPIEMEVHRSDESVHMCIGTLPQLGTSFEWISKPAQRSSAPLRTLHFAEQGLVDMESVRVGQISVVVHDIKATTANYSVFFHADGPANFLPYFMPDSHPLTNMIWADLPVNSAVGVLVSITSIGGMQFEVVEPMLGASTWQRFLASTGGGIHHIMLTIKDPIKAEAAFRHAGYIVDVSATIAGMNPAADLEEMRAPAFTYMNGAIDLGMNIEFSGGTPRPMH